MKKSALKGLDYNLISNDDKPSPINIFKHRTKCKSRCFTKKSPSHYVSFDLRIDLSKHRTPSRYTRMIICTDISRFIDLDYELDKLMANKRQLFKTANCQSTRVYRTIILLTVP